MKCVRKSIDLKRLFTTSAPSNTNAIVHKYTSPGVLQIKFNRPEKLNALSVEVGNSFNQLIQELKQGLKILNFKILYNWIPYSFRNRLDAKLKVVVLTGEGKAFSAGGDFNFLNDRMNTKDAEINHNEMMLFYNRFLSVRQLQVPVISGLQEINNCFVCYSTFKK